jgi:hypothetical protein
VGGSADLTGSNNTKSKELKPLTAADYGGRYVYYGIREHGMAAAMNGMALHGGVIPYGGTFLVFTDYCRPSIRLSALMQQRVIYVMTHDSIGLGEDGPTHQPVEHLAAMRVIPNLAVYRPCDAVETAECWQLALKDETRPSILALTRQKLKPARIAYAEENLCAKGAYEIASSDKQAEVVIFASGSEVEIAIAAKAQLDAAGKPARVVSVPSMENFEAAGPSLQGPRAGNREDPHRHRGGCAHRLGPFHRRGGNLHRHDRFRRIRAGGTSLQAFRHYRRSRGKSSRLRRDDMPAFRTLDDVNLRQARAVPGGSQRAHRNGVVTDATRIERVVPTLREIMNKGGALIVLAHFDRPKGKVVPEMSLRPVAAALEQHLGAP